MSYQEILFDVSDGIATITLNRPEKLNAWTGVMETEVRDAMNAASVRADVRAIILTGAGRGFCAGADMDNLQSIGDGQRSNSVGIPAAPGAIEDGLAVTEDFKQRYSYFPSVPKPIIAAVNGPCAGLGMVMALYADIRFAAEGVKFTTSFSRRGLIAEHGISWMLPRLVGLSNALDLLLSGRVVMADEALHMGLVSNVFPPETFMAEVRAYATEIVKMVSPRSVRVMKQQLYNVQFQTLQQAIFTANEEMTRSFDSEDFREGVAHFVEKRHPKFTGR